MSFNKNNPWFKQSLRLLTHEFKRGEITIIAFAIILAVTMVLSLTGFTAHVKDALYENSTRFIAADKIWQSRLPVDHSIIAKSDDYKVKSAQLVQMSSMVFAGNDMLLSSIKAVSSAYPLRGELIIEKNKTLPPKLLTSSKVTSNYIAVNAPPRGSVWIESRLQKQMNVVVGDTIDVGVLPLKIAGVTTNIPDASFSVFTSGPVVIMNVLDLPATQLIQPGSRVTYKYLFAGKPNDLKEFSTWVEPQVLETQRWYDIASRQSPLTKALKRAEKYLSLASMLGIVLAAVAISVATRRYSQRHQPMVAVLKALGASMMHIRLLYCLHWGLLSTLSIIVGLMIGWGILNVGLYAVREHVHVTLPAIAWYPFIVAIVTGLVCAIMFALIPLKQLVSTTALSVIRGFPPYQVLKRYHAMPVATLFGLLCLFGNDAYLSAALIIGGLVVSILLWGLGQIIMNVGRKVGSQAGKSWHLAMANLKRRSRENSVQLISFTVAIKLLLLILVLKNTLIDEWKQQLPVDAANRFLVNITEPQVPAIHQFVAKHNLDASSLYPMVLGRLTAINHDKIKRKVTKESANASDNGRRGVGRELRLTWSNVLPPKNILVEGEWWTSNEHLAQVSVESKVAERLGIVLGDTLSFNLGSEAIDVVVSSIREVDWQSLQPNFFMIFNPVVLDKFPASYIASLYLPADKQDQLQQFLSNYPTISVIDIDAMIIQLKDVINQVSLAIEFILFFVIVAGALVLVAQVQASMEERERELAILRSLGASGRLLKQSILFEFVALGFIAGAMASIAMEVALYLLQTSFFSMTPSLHPQYWLIGAISGALFVGVLGYLSCRKLLSMSSLTLIRRTL